MPGEMSPLSFEKLLHWIDRESTHLSSIFGIPFSAFYKPSKTNPYSLFGKKTDNMLGPAAGPHTQMANNIIASYLTGGRFFELKTVQILDELNIDKPCINAQDECYNVEWSQELKLEQSFDEYLKAFLILTFFSHVISGGKSPAPGFIFNMSVGYNLEGIKTERVDRFIEQLKNPSLSGLFGQYKAELIQEIRRGKFTNFIYRFSPGCSAETIAANLERTPSCISDSITLSTMHGCPADEIESIASYLMSEKKLTTLVKLNPTLLGYTFVRNALDTLGFGYLELDPHGFEKDISFDAAVPMIKRLNKRAAENKVTFGIKLSNTLAVKNSGEVLPGGEQYASGRVLFPLTINLAGKIVPEIDKDIPVSYSGGITVQNIKSVLESGIAPVTLATDLLKPGGYLRLKQMAEIAETVPQKNGIDLSALSALAGDSLKNISYRKETREIHSVKVPLVLPQLDCYMAPCTAACPVHQDVADYIHLAGEGKFREALSVIMDKNPLPNITSYICDHQCMFHCTRWDYDEPVKIRDIKKYATENGYDSVLSDIKQNYAKQSNGKKAAVIGAGPSGLSAAFYLTINGFDVTVYEKELNAGGIVKNIIPQFRIPADVIQKDIDLITELGVNFVFGADPVFSAENLKRQGFDYIYIGIGAGKANELGLKKSRGNILDAVPFLRNYNQGIENKLGKNVAVIGGGNSAMDGARAAKRTPGVENVYIIYRRTRAEMPADKEEYDAAIEDGVIFRELLLPEEFSANKLKCNKMLLSEPGPDGRRSVKEIPGEFETFTIDSVISAIGEKVDEALLSSNGVRMKTNGKPFVTEGSRETSLENVFIGGDALRGPSTIIESAADGRAAAEAITQKAGFEFRTLLKKYPDTDAGYRIDTASSLKGILSPAIINMKEEASRCLSCNLVCNKCVDVCPNRANVVVSTSSFSPLFKDSGQIVHMDSLCNECGNCETFCPYNGKPYKDKLTVYSNAESFGSGTNDGFYYDRGKNIINMKIGGTALSYSPGEFIEETDIGGEFGRQKKIADIIINRYEYLV